MNNNNVRKYTIAVIVTLLILVCVIGVTYAFFNPNVDSNGITTVNIELAEQATISFTGGKDVTIDAKQPGVAGELYFSVGLKSDGGDISAAYDIIWNITENSFVKDVNNPDDKELLYSLYISTDNINWEPLIIDAEATTLYGENKLATNELILATNNSEKVNYYKFVITYPSLAKDQSYNMEAVLNSYLEVKQSEE
ncbi:MAG: hypothetical protein IJA94_00215 [Bacilli bacterium]|nr:hypothetical protein [Bacilli bacterium]